METTRNEPSPYASFFFKKLGTYLDTKIYYFGSIQRNDYFPKSSDIDIDIFTENESSTISKLQNFLGLQKAEFKKFVYKLHKTNKVVYGHKVKYKDEVNLFSVEISIYNEKNKKDVLIEHNSKIVLPFYISCMLVLLKYLYYTIGILPKGIYKYSKKIIMNYMVEGEDDEFITTEIPKQK
jgi:predicted nucleotidyltransferase